MLKNIVLLLEHFENKLDKNKISPAAICSDIGSEACLAITDEAAFIPVLREKNIPILFITDKEEFISGVSYITDSLLDCDYEYLDMVFCREKNIPLNILETDRCLIREMTLEDLPRLYEIYEDAEIKKYVEPLYAYEQEVEYTKNYIRQMYEFHGFGVWAIVEKESGMLIGRAGISIRESEGNWHELGYLLAAEYRGKGIAYEVCSAITNYWKQKIWPETQTEGLRILTKALNLPSCGLAIRLGFKPNGCLRIDDCEYMIFQCKE